jgi:hypothetical protein
MLIAMGFWALLPLAAVGAQNRNDDTIVYEVKRGDTLIDLSRKFMIRPIDYRQVQRANRIADPHFLPVGLKLRISRDLLKYQATTARALSVRGGVFVVRDNQSRPLLTNANVGEGNIIQTAAASFTTLELEDGSRISIPSNSSIRISRLRKYLLGSSIDYDFDVAKGGVRSTVTAKQSPNDRYRVRTPKAVSAVRGTDFQSRYDAAKNADYAEVVEGSLAVDTGTVTEQPIAAGRGLSVSAGGAVTREELLPAPNLPTAGKLQARNDVRFDYTASGHQNMRVTLGSDAGFVDILADVLGTDGTADFGNIEDGNYFVRFRPVSDAGFEGMPKTYAFKRRINDVKATAGKTDVGYAFKWTGSGRGNRLYHFQLLRGSRESMPMVDEAGLSQNQIILSDLIPGEYYWRVASIQYLDGEVNENWTDFEQLTVSAP